MKRGIETKLVGGVWVALGVAGLVAPSFGQSTSQRTGGVVVVDLSDDIHEAVSLGWEATAIEDPDPRGAQRHEGNLADDMLSGNPGSASPFGGAIQDAGTIYVDLGSLSGEADLDLVFEAKPIGTDPRVASKPEQESGARLRLFGGTPGTAAGIVIDVAAPEAGKATSFFMGGQVIDGSFAADGSFVVELPDALVKGPFYAGGFAVEDGGTVVAPVRRSKILRVSEVDGEATVEVALEESGIETELDAKPIADAVHGILAGTPAGSASRAHFYGHAGFGGLDEVVDVTVTLRRARSGFELHLDRELAERSLDLDLEEGGAILCFPTEEALGQATFDVALVATFGARVDERLAQVRRSLGDARAQVGLSQALRGGWQGGGPGPRPAAWSKSLRMAGPSASVERSVDLSEDAVEVEVGDATGIAAGRPAKKQTPSQKKPLEPGEEPQDGGSVEVDLGHDKDTLGWMGDVTLGQANASVDLAKAGFDKLMRQRRELDAASASVSVKQRNLKKHLHRP